MTSTIEWNTTNIALQDVIQQLTDLTRNNPDLEVIHILNPQWNDRQLLELENKFPKFILILNKKFTTI